MPSKKKASSSSSGSSQQQQFHHFVTEPSSTYICSCCASAIPAVILEDHFTNCFSQLALKQLRKSSKTPKDTICVWCQQQSLDFTASGSADAMLHLQKCFAQWKLYKHALLLVPLQQPGEKKQLTANQETSHDDNNANDSTAEKRVQKRKRLKRAYDSDEDEGSDHEGEPKPKSSRVAKIMQSPTSSTKSILVISPAKSVEEEIDHLETVDLIDLTPANQGLNDDSLISEESFINTSETGDDDEGEEEALQTLLGDSTETKETVWDALRYESSEDEDYENKEDQEDEEDEETADEGDEEGEDGEDEQLSREELKELYRDLMKRKIVPEATTEEAREILHELLQEESEAGEEAKKKDSDDEEDALDFGNEEEEEGDQNPEEMFEYVDEEEEDPEDGFIVYDDDEEENQDGDAEEEQDGEEDEDDDDDGVENFSDHIKCTKCGNYHKYYAKCNEKRRYMSDSKEAKLEAKIRREEAIIDREQRMKRRANKRK